MNLLVYLVYLYTRPRDVRNYMLQIKPENNAEYLFRAVWSKTKLGLK